MSYHPKRQRRAEDQGIDDWLMTYADMITLLLCFFAVFLSVSVPKKEIFDQAREKVLEQFSSGDILEGKFPPAPVTAKSNQPYDALPSIVDRFPGGEDLNNKEGTVKSKGESDQKNDVKDLKENRQPLPPPPKQDEGDRITVIDVPSAAFFDIGSADLSSEGKKLLQELIQSHLNKAVAEGYQITIEGHTDDTPIRTRQFPSNWELSTGRAAAVVRFLIEQGLPAQSLRAAGYADSFPKTPNRDAAGKAIPENQAQNRRVVLKLEKIEKPG